MGKRIGLIDVDGHNFPNIPLMKISAWHKKQGDSVEWYEQMKHGFPFEPLDGFPDGWTQYGASGKEMSSNARIKALGNSIAVPCAERVFIGILAAEREVQENG